MEAIVMWDSERGVAAPDLSWQIGAPVMWPPQCQRHDVFLNSPIACNLDDDLCLHFIVKKCACFAMQPRMYVKCE
jgi:hypothetical protein